MTANGIANTDSSQIRVRLASAGVVALLMLSGISQLTTQVAAQTAPASQTKVTKSTEPTADKLTFEEHIQPILQIRCFKCHGEKVRKSGLDLRRRFTILKGGDGGAAIVPGKPGESLLIEMIGEGTMPPKDEGRLSQREIELLKRWVAGGAMTKAAKEPPLEVVAADSEVSDEDRKFWAFQPPVRPVVPTVKDASRVRNAIDAFLLARIEAAGGNFNSDASKLTLIRRACFDLTGLPPTPDDIDAFLTDEESDAYERLIDRLLASPRYGERWGRHWLDVAGYADSDGYLEADRLRPEAWRYRDYVVRALNDDKPYDRFILEQMAGDELEDWRRRDEITPQLADNLIATGFLRTASDPTYGNYKEKLECYKVMADTMQIVSSTFLGLTVQCARCHSHKFDPIPHRDYYQMHAVLTSSYDPNRWQVSLARAVPLATEAETARITKRNQQVDARLKQLQAELAELTMRNRSKLLDQKLSHLADAALRGKVKSSLLVAAKKRNAEQKKLVGAHAAKVTATDDELAAAFPKFKSTRDRLQATVNAETSLKGTIVQLRGLADLDDKPQPTFLLRRGDFDKPGRQVEPGVPSVLAPAGFQLKPQPGYKTTGRRAALARWMIDPQHPLTARVHVNRIWAQHFGRGIVATLDNFGRAGERPTHPELLDWLAVEFIAGGWSQKAIHRLIMTSTAYRQSSQPNRQLQTADPNNLLLGAWRPRRHEGEVVRDSALAVAGKLNLQMFGQPIPVTRHSTGLVTVADNPQGSRRSVYLIVRRSQPVTLLELFDTPRMEVNCTRRNESIVVTQALTMLNSKFIETMSQSLASRLIAAVPSDGDARIDSAFRLVYGRLPRQQERQSVSSFLQKLTATELAQKANNPTVAEQSAAERSAWNQLAIILLNSNEFLYIH